MARLSLTKLKGSFVRPGGLKSLVAKLEKGILSSLWIFLPLLRVAGMVLVSYAHVLLVLVPDIVVAQS